jgi:Flp pilus assembly protein TadD
VPPKHIAERRPPDRIAPVVVALTTFVAFIPGLRNGFTDWDDQKNFLDNAAYRGLDLEHLRWMFTTFFSGHYQPLSWLTLAIDHAFWGLQPSGYHLTNLLLHVANAVVFYLIARSLLAAARPGAAARDLTVAASLSALLFAVHPLRVESVAWVTERRNVLAAFFYLLSVHQYLKGRKGLAWSFAFFVLSLLSEAIGITLPLVLLVLDFYPLGRLPDKEPGAWPEKLPFFLASAVFGGVGVLAQSAAGGVNALESHSLGQRAAQAAYGLTFYIGKTLAPTGLSPLYEVPFPFQPWVPRFIACGLFVAALTAALVVLRRRFPAALAAWSVYVAALLPVIGLLHLWIQLAADRYTYLSCLGWAVLTGGLFLVAVESGAAARRAATAGAVVVVAVLGTLSWGQCAVWHDSNNLWERVAAVEPSSSFAHDHLGLIRAQAGDLDGAAAHFRAAIAANPLLDLAHTNLAVTLASQGHFDEAVSEYRRTLEIDPRNRKALNNLGLLLLSRGRFEDGIEVYRRILELQPDFVPAMVNIGSALLRLNRPREAVPYFQAAQRLDPESAQIRANLARAQANAVGGPR